jgi:hypothetical protein
MMIHIFKLTSNLAWLKKGTCSCYQELKIIFNLNFQSIVSHSYNIPEYHFLQPSPTLFWILGHSPMLWLFLSGIGYIQPEDHSKTDRHFIYKHFKHVPQKEYGSEKTKPLFLQGAFFTVAYIFTITLMIHIFRPPLWSSGCRPRGLGFDSWRH